MAEREFVGQLPEKEEPSVQTAEAVTVESLHLVADSLGIDSLHLKAATHLSKHVVFKIKFVVQFADRFRRKAKRSRLSAKDFHDAISILYSDSQLGNICRDYSSLRSSGAGNTSTSSPVQIGSEFFAANEKDIDLNEVLQTELPKYPAESSLKCHWLAVDSKQPAVPENPSLVTEKDQVHNLLASYSNQAKGYHSNSGAVTKRKNSVAASNINSGVKLKAMRFHELSTEQQLYFKEITEACMNTNEERKSEALACLSTDPGLHVLLPRFSSFISQGVRMNVVHRSLAILIYLMRMLSALINNPTISLEKYLHELVPAVFTCIVNKQLVDQHWALRSFAARCLSTLCHSYTNNINNLQPRCVNVLKQALREMTSIGFPSLFGVVCALGELGSDTVRSTLFPFVKSLGNVIQEGLHQNARREQQYQDASGQNVEATDEVNIRKGAQEVQNKIVKVIASCVNSEMPEMVDFNAFKMEFGYLGPIIYNEVSRLRQQQTQQQLSAVSFSAPNMPMRTASAAHRHNMAAALMTNHRSGPPVRTNDYSTPNYMG